MNSHLTSNTSIQNRSKGSSTPQKQRQTKHHQQQQKPTWIRGVNLGGWLVLERYIAPYQFAITNCHLAGDLCWYPGSLSIPTNASDNTTRTGGGGSLGYPPYCDLNKCQPVRTKVTVSSDGMPIDPNDLENAYDYPLDEYTLAQAFGTNPKQRQIATEWFNYHFQHFITIQDIQQLQRAGITHVRIPIPHWILGIDPTIVDDEVWIIGKRWESLLRVLSWCRTYNIQVWLDLHTAPGSQNGFDNSGHALHGVSCQGWSNSTLHVQRTLQVITDICHGIVQENYTDIVTGFGLLNEPFKDCNRTIYDDFVVQGLWIVRNILGPNTHVYISDMFLAKSFNDGQYWVNPNLFYSTYLDSHYYHVFAEQPRSLSPKQHIGYVCENEYRDVISCCYQDGNITKSKLLDDQFGKLTVEQQEVYGSYNHIPSVGISRIIGEWSAALDTLPVSMLKLVMNEIAKTGIAYNQNRIISHSRQLLLLNFVQAQMVAYEAAAIPQLSSGWFYWNIKMEGGAFAEWDFLRGIQEGWIPLLPKSHIASEEIFGTCYDIMMRTNDTMSKDVLEEFPPPDTLPKSNWQGVQIDDDVVVSHGDSLIWSSIDHHYEKANGSDTLATPTSTINTIRNWWSLRRNGPYGDELIGGLLLVVLFICMVLIRWLPRFACGDSHLNNSRHHIYIQTSSNNNSRNNSINNMKMMMNHGNNSRNNSSTNMRSNYNQINYNIKSSHKASSENTPLLSTNNTNDVTSNNATTMMMTKKENVATMTV